MGKSQHDRDSMARNAAMGIGTMVLAIVSFLVMLWVVMAIVRLLFG